MHYVFMLAHLWPSLAVCLCIPSLQLGIYYRNKRDKRQWAFWAFMVFLVISAGLWFFFRGDRNADAWVKRVFLMD